MKAVIQRVLNASVAVDGQTISSIGKGLLVLVGIDKSESHDDPSDSSAIIKKILSAKLFDEAGEGWKKNVQDIEGEVLCVSQFTLLATFKGSKPDFHDSMSTVPGKAHYTSFLEEIRAAYRSEKIKDGQFGAMMQVSLTNDGPVTILLSSRDKPAKSGSSTPNQADEARQKQKEQAEAKARKREAAEARVREKEQLRQQKEEEWKRRNAEKEGPRTGVEGAVEGLSLGSKE